MQNQLIPGLVSADTEFFNHDGKVKAIHDGSVFDFSDLPIKTIHGVTRIMEADKPAMEVLRKWYPSGGHERVEKFVSCRFGGLDNQADLGAQSAQDGEYWDCPLRGNCSGEGRVCHMPQWNGHRLTSEEISLMKHCSTTLTNTAIAEVMGMADGTLNAFRKKLYAKLGVQTKQEVTRIAVALNIIKPH